MVNLEGAIGKLEGSKLGELEGKRMGECEGEMLELNSSIVTGGSVTYEWFFNDGTGAISLGTTDVPTYFINDVDSSYTGVYTVLEVSEIVQLNLQMHRI